MVQSRELVETCFQNSDISELLQQDWRNRIFNPQETDAQNTEQLLELRKLWSGENGDWPSTTVLTSGVYDLLHLDHQGYLIHTKALGAGQHFDAHYADITGISWQDLAPEDRLLWLQEFICSGELKQIVSIDGNSDVAIRKGFNPDKGNSVRPVLDWMSRARAVAALTMQTTVGTYTPIVDAVTIHDKYELAGTPHAELYDLAAMLQPDVWSVYSESTDILARVPTDDRLQGIAVICISEDDNYFNDKLLQGRFSTTGIIKRMIGEVT